MLCIKGALTVLKWLRKVQPALLAAKNPKWLSQSIHQAGKTSISTARL
jgi:hypothetical protein